MFEELFVVVYFFLGIIFLGLVMGLFFCAEIAFEELMELFSEKEDNDERR